MTSDAPRPSPEDLVEAEFDVDFYLATNEDVAESGIDPWLHFRTFGWREKRDPTPDFSVAKYLDLHPDVAALQIDPFDHYVRHGRAEGRPTDHEYGLRYDILIGRPAFEERIQIGSRLAERPRPDMVAALDEALLSVGERTGPSGGLHLTFSHDDYTAIPGGVQLCIRLESEAVQAAGRTHLNLHPAPPGQTIEVEREDSLVQLHLDGRSVGCFSYADVAASLAAWSGGRPASIAVHSLIGHSVDGVLQLAAAVQAPDSYVWLHDFSSLCANYALMRNDVEYCGAPDLLSNACTLCAYGQRRPIHLAEHARLFDVLDVTVLAPSSAAADLWADRFPGRHEVRVHPHARLVPRPGSRQKARTGPLHVAFPGMATLHKGWPVFSELVRRFEGDPRYSFHHLGRSPDPRVPGVAFTRVAPGEAEREPMIAAIDALDIDVAVVWSVWPETFCFTAYEAAAGGAFVLTGPLAGHVVELASQAGRGFVARDEDHLFSLFETGEIAALARPARVRQDLEYSRMSADFIGGPAT